MKAKCDACREKTDTGNLHSMCLCPDCLGRLDNNNVAKAPCPFHDPGEPCSLKGADGCCFEMPCEVTIAVPEKGE